MKFFLITGICVLTVVSASDGAVVLARAAEGDDNLNEAAGEPGLCQSCECKADVVYCSLRKLNSNLADVSWPEGPLKFVTYDSNDIAYVKAFPNVTIERLILSRNKIEKIDDEAFKLITNLTELDLSHNQLTSSNLKPSVFEGKFSPNEWEPLEQLRILNLGYNNLHTLNQDLFEHITDLTVLILKGNPFSIIDHSSHLAIGNLINLEELDLSHCDLEALPDHLFHEPKDSLKRLHLCGNKLTSVPSALEDATALEYINLNDNPIQTLQGSNVFPQLPNLREIRLESMHSLTKVGAGAFSQLDAVEYVYLKNCPKLEEINDDAFVKHTNHGAIWPPLKVLEISGNALQYLPVTLVGRWDKLEKLELTDNKWTCDCDNQYMVGNLLPKLGRSLMGDSVKALACSAPPEHAGKSMLSLANRKLRCLDLYGARPERDTAILVGLMIGLLLAIPIALTLFLFWRRGYFFCNDHQPGSFSRAFYKRTSNDDDL